jgi:hypothetical protein
MDRTMITCCRAAILKAAAVLALATAMYGCGTQTPLYFSGFWPIEPAPTFRDRFPKVETLNPTLAWEPFPGTDYDVTDTTRPKPRPFVDTGMREVSNIRYDVIVWKAVDPHYPVFDDLTVADVLFCAGLCAAGNAPKFHSREWVTVDSLLVVYERNGLTGLSHVVETALEPNTEYAWSVRARFVLDEATRVSEWSLVALPNIDCVVNARPGLGIFPNSNASRECGGSSRSRARQVGQLPPYALYYFKTPPAPAE